MVLIGSYKVFWVACLGDLEYFWPCSKAFREMISGSSWHFLANPRQEGLMPGKFFSFV